MDSYFYFYFDNRERSVGTVCLLTDHETMVHSRGLALCCYKDFGNMSKKRGRVIAKGRALKAMKKGYDLKNIRRLNVIEMWNSFSGLMVENRFSNGAYNVSLTSFEFSLISKAG